MRADGETITTQVWFPTSDSMGETVKYEGILDGQSLLDAGPNCDEVRPVVVFSHGNGGVRWQSAFNMHFLATHGFVVVAMDHIYNTFRDLDREKFLEHVLQRPRDVRDTFDWLLSKSLEPDHALSGCIQPDAGYAVMGHSFGGYTSFMSAGATVDTAVLATACDDGEEGACQLVENWAAQSDAPLIDVSDDRVWAAVTWSPWHAAGILSDGMADVRVPSLTITGTLDELHRSHKLKVWWMPPLRRTTCTSSMRVILALHPSRACFCRAMDAGMVNGDRTAQGPHQPNGHIILGGKTRLGECRRAIQSNRRR